jgi:hypothetical protein
MRPVEGKAAAAAVNALQTQLDRHLAAVDGMDQKAALLPPALGLVGVLGLVLPAGVTGWKLALDVLGVAGGLFAIVSCFMSLRVRTVPTGGDEDQIANGVDLGLADFNVRLARSLAAAARGARSVEREKANWLNVAFASTGVAILSWVLAHAVGG